MVKRTDEGLLVTSRARGLLKPIAACLPLVTGLNCVCSLIRTCCSTTKSGLLQERGMTISVLRLQTLFVSQVASSPTSSAPENSHCFGGRRLLRGIPRETAKGTLKSAWEGYPSTSDIPVSRRNHSVSDCTSVNHAHREPSRSGPRTI